MSGFINSAAVSSKGAAWSTTWMGAPPGVDGVFTIAGGAAPISTSFDTRPGWRGRRSERPRRRQWRGR